MKRKEKEDFQGGDVRRMSNSSMNKMWAGQQISQSERRRELGSKTMLEGQEGPGYCEPWTPVYQTITFPKPGNSLGAGREEMSSL